MLHEDLGFVQRWVFCPAERLNVTRIKGLNSLQHPTTYCNKVFGTAAAQYPLRRNQYELGGSKYIQIHSLSTVQLVNWRLLSHKVEKEGEHRLTENASQGLTQSRQRRPPNQHALDMAAAPLPTLALRLNHRWRDPLHSLNQGKIPDK